MNSLLVKGLQFVCNPFLFEYSRNYFLGKNFYFTNCGIS